MIVLGLVVASFAAGCLLLWVFRCTAEADRIERAKKRLQARLLELRVWGEDPVNLLRTQAELLRENARYFAAMLRPAGFASLPLAGLVVVMQGLYGWRPLTVGEAAVVTVQFRSTEALRGPIELEAPPGIAVETPPVRAVASRQVSWRIRALAPVRGWLQVRAPGFQESKSIRAGNGLGWVSPRRVRSLWQWLWQPWEARLQADRIEWIAVGYPAAEWVLFGLRAHWLVWFLVLSMLTALVLRKPFGVVI